MLHIESVIHDFVSSLGPTITALERHNRGLADQLDRASCSIVLNVAEGNYSQKANRPARYFNALGFRGRVARMSAARAGAVRHRRRCTCVGPTRSRDRGAVQADAQEVKRRGGGDAMPPPPPLFIPCVTTARAPRLRDGVVR